MKEHFFCFGRKVTPPQTSIHPRVINGRTVGPKRSTTRKSNGGSLRQAIAGITKHLEIHKGDGAAAACKAKFEARLGAL